MNPTTTLAQIRACHPCSDGWSKLLAGLGYADGNYDPERVVSLGDIATTNGAADAFWAIRALDWSDINVRRAVIAGSVLLAVKRVLKYTTDNVLRECVDALDRWCKGDDSVDLLTVRKRARSAAADAAYAAAAAAYAAADAAAAAADAAAYAAADAAAYAAADAAAAAAYAAERKHQIADILANFACVALKTISEAQ